MVLKESAQLDRIFHALANPARRKMLRELAAGKQRVGELAAPLSMTFAGASKHVRVLEQAGLLRRQVQGREHVMQIEAKPLADAEEWIRFYERLWTEQFDALDAALRAEDVEINSKSKRKKK